jgi:hypothetical protein
MGLSLACYNFATPEIRVLTRHVLDHAVSARTIKRLAKSAGSKLKRGRPRSTPRVQKRDLNHLIEFSCSNADSLSENTLQFLREVYTQFGLTPRQYLQWVAKTIRRGKCMMRRCLLCENEFASMSAGDRHCPSCKAGRNRLLKNTGA